MLRGLVVMSLVGAGFAAGLYFRDRGVPSFDRAKPSAPPVRQQSCEDDCEQAALVASASEAEMRACKTRCKGPVSAPTAHEVPRSITVAPADHSGGLRVPSQRRITRTR